MLSIPILDLSLATDPEERPQLLAQLHDALFNIGFLYVRNHSIPQSTIDDLIEILPSLFQLPDDEKLKVAKLNSPHFLGYNGYAEESTLGQKDLREQFDFATELPVVWLPQPKYDHVIDKVGGRDFAKQYWRLRGPNQWPEEDILPKFRDILTT